MNLPTNQILTGNCLEIMADLPEKSFDLVFADPPYNLQLRQELYRPNMTRVDGVDDTWDRFESFEDYDTFTRQWLSACRRLLKDSGSIWVIGSYHNIFRIGGILQDLGFWILNDVIWIKTNPMPNFRGVRFTNAHETLIWASKTKGSRYTFNHHDMKDLNDGLQMRSDWTLPVCNGSERLRDDDGQKIHPTQKPEALLYRVILSSTRPGDLVLDPFFGSGTTGAVAKSLNRRWVGIERDPDYIKAASRRIAEIPDPVPQADIWNRRPRIRVPFGHLLEAGLLHPGQMLYFRCDRTIAGQIRADGRIILNELEGSIHKVGSNLMGGSPCNGWDHWYYETSGGDLLPIDTLRKQLTAGSPGKSNT